MTAPETTPYQSLLDLDRIVHEPARLAILMILARASEVEFKFLEAATGLTKGNLSSHVAKLETAGYVEVVKAFRRKTPVTSFRITEAGRQALAGYLEQIRSVLPPVEGSP
jgi:DNA-binding transcriptional ArsR family regulator